MIATVADTLGTPINTTREEPVVEIQNVRPDPDCTVQLLWSHVSREPGGPLDEYPLAVEGLFAEETGRAAANPLEHHLITITVPDGT